MTRSATLMVQNRSTAAVQKHANELVEKAKAMGGDLAKAAKSMGLETKTSNDVDRGGQYRRHRHGQLLAEGFTQAGRRDLRTGRVCRTAAPSSAKVVSHCGAGSVAVGRAAQRRFAMRSRASARASATRLFEAGVQGYVDQAGKDQDPPGRDQPADWQLPHQLTGPDSRPGQLDLTLMLIATEKARMLHGLLQVWFGWVRDGGYLGIIASDGDGKLDPSGAE